jgi:hypothetical protein
MLVLTAVAPESMDQNSHSDFSVGCMHDNKLHASVSSYGEGEALNNNYYMTVVYYVSSMNLVKVSLSCGPQPASVGVDVCIKSVPLNP